MTSAVYCGFKATNQSINDAGMIKHIHTSEFEKHKICINSSLSFYSNFDFCIEKKLRLLLGFVDELISYNFLSISN